MDNSEADGQLREAERRKNSKNNMKLSWNDKATLRSLQITPQKIHHSIPFKQTPESLAAPEPASCPKERYQAFVVIRFNTSFPLCESSDTSTQTFYPAEPQLDPMQHKDNISHVRASGYKWWAGSTQQQDSNYTASHHPHLLSDEGQREVWLLNVLSATWGLHVSLRLRH